MARKPSRKAWLLPVIAVVAVLVGVGLLGRSIYALSAWRSAQATVLSNPPIESRNVSGPASTVYQPNFSVDDGQGNTFNLKPAWRSSTMNWDEGDTVTILYPEGQAHRFIFATWLSLWGWPAIALLLGAGVYWLSRMVGRRSRGNQAAS